MGLETWVVWNSSTHLMCGGGILAPLNLRNTYDGRCTYYRRSTVCNLKNLQPLVYVWFKAYTNFQTNRTRGWLKNCDVPKMARLARSAPSVFTRDIMMSSEEKNQAKSKIRKKKNKEDSKSSNSMRFGVNPVVVGTYTSWCYGARYKKH